MNTKSTTVIEALAIISGILFFVLFVSFIVTGISLIGWISVFIWAVANTLHEITFRN